MDKRLAGATMSLPPLMDIDLTHRERCFVRRARHFRDYINVFMANKELQELITPVLYAADCHYVCPRKDPEKEFVC